MVPIRDTPGREELSDCSEDEGASDESTYTEDESIAVSTPTSSADDQREESHHSGPGVTDEEDDAISTKRSSCTRRFVTISVIALSLTAITAESTFTEWRRKLKKMGLHQTRGGANEISRTYTNSNGDSIRIPRGVPLPPPVLSALCSPHEGPEDCANFHKADCSWCGAIERCVAVDFAPSFCNVKKELL